MSIRLGGCLKELRFHLCQTSPQSKGVREFIQNNYVALKKANPNFPILIRECNGVMPVVWARYAYGVETFCPLMDLDESKVLAVLKRLTEHYPPRA